MTASTLKEKIAVCIPVFNNHHTIFNIAQKAKLIWNNVIIVDDGSKDCDLSSLLKPLNITLLTHKKNKGKGKALSTAFQYAAKKGFEYLITLDGDGQHYPDDILKFIPHIDDHEAKIIIGARNFNQSTIPEASRFGRKFSNFWIHLETGATILDSQSGFRAYPVKEVLKIRCKSKSYDFEIEILTRLLWNGVKALNIPISVYYPNKKERVSHFKPFKDNLKLTILHTKLILYRLFPFKLPKKYQITKKKQLKIIKGFHPIKLFKYILTENLSSAGVSAAFAVGIIIGTLPLIGCHSIVIIYISTRLHLNKLISLSSQNFCVPPIVPALCIYVGHFLRSGKLFSDYNLKAIFCMERLWEWLLGSLLLAPIFGIISFLIIYSCSSIIFKKRT